jgi:hypothetical protein
MSHYNLAGDCRSQPGTGLGTVSLVKPLVSVLALRCGALIQCDVLKAIITANSSPMEPVNNTGRKKPLLYNSKMTSLGGLLSLADKIAS